MDGTQGIQGIQGEPGLNGHTPVITIENGNWYIDGVDSGVKAQGIQGPQGEPGQDGTNGLSAYEIFLKYYPDYQGTEEEWIYHVATNNLCALFGHQEEVIPSVDYTCTTDGLTEGIKCSICLEILKEQEVILAHHQYINLVKDEYLKDDATCLSGAIYYKSCEECKEKNENDTFEHGDMVDCVFDNELVDDMYLKQKATYFDVAEYYKSCIWCDKKGEETFNYGDTLESVMYMPTSLTVSIYDAANHIYGFTYNTLEKPYEPVIQIQQGNEFTSEYDEYACEVTKAKTNDDNGVPYEYYIAKVTIQLQNDIQYSYRAYDNVVGIGSDITSFKVKNTQDSSFTFSHIGDTQDYPSYFNLVLSSIYNSSDFIVHSGDLVQQGGYESHWDAMLNGNYEYVTQIPIMAISGNHEVTYGGGSNETFKHFNNNIPTQASTKYGYFYSFIYENIKFIMINTNDLKSNKLKDEQYNWIINELENNTSLWTVVVMHNPMYSVGKWGANPEINQISLALREQLQGIFAEYGVDLVLQGHDHVVSRTNPIDENGIVQETTWQIENDINYSVDPSGVIYVMSGTGGGQKRSPYEVDEDLYYYALASNSRSWSEFSIDGNKLTVNVKYYKDGEIYTYQTWGIIKE